MQPLLALALLDHGRHVAIGLLGEVEDVAVMLETAIFFGFGAMKRDVPAWPHGIVLVCERGMDVSAHVRCLYVRIWQRLLESACFFKILSCDEICKFDASYRFLNAKQVGHW